MKQVGDARKILPTLESNSKDGGITDPPWDHLKKHMERGTTTRLVKKEGRPKRKGFIPMLPLEDIAFCMKECLRILKPHRHFYLFSNGLALEDAMHMMKDVGFTYLQVILWDSRHQGLGYNYTNRGSVVLFYTKGPKEKRAPLIGSPINVAPPFRTTHTLYKPWELYRWLLQHSLKKGESVLDPFAGEKPPLEIAAHKLGLESLSIDLR